MSDADRLFVGCLPTDISEAELKAVFSTYGKVQNIDIRPNKGKGSIAFVSFVHKSEAEEAFNLLHKSDYKIRAELKQPLLVDWAKPKDSKSGGGRGKSSRDEPSGNWKTGRDSKGSKDSSFESWSKHKSPWRNDGWQSDSWESKGKSWDSCKSTDNVLFIGNLPQDADADAVNYVFKTYGTIDKIHLIEGLSKNKRRNCAYVQFANSEDAELARATLDERYEFFRGSGEILVKWACASMSRRHRPY
eukprot:TRINITY_DN42669_c0_g1_i1.p1 TRINITY_DN42669_c0_g1~~TRINITY_DN42669_c0_g1_i1.p1  ORF type:complete len:246 (+),score=39.77 TRINITY_DN42669_c0_g1_i1:25-762(+)